MPSLEVLKQHPRYARQIVTSSDEEVKAAIKKRRKDINRFASSSGGLVSTSADLVKFMRLHSLEGKIKEKTTDFRRCPRQTIQISARSQRIWIRLQAYG